jgi:hypothetical protein
MRYFVGSWLRPTTGSVTNKQVSLTKTPQFGVFFYGKNKITVYFYLKYLYGKQYHSCRFKSVKEHY